MTSDASAAAAGHPASLLIFGTVLMAVLLAAVLITYFLKKRGSRHPRATGAERHVDTLRAEKPATDA